MRRTALALLVAVTWSPTAQVVGQTTDRPAPEPLGWPQEQQDRHGPGLVSRIAWGIGGAALGAGLGFFASQLVQGDWQEDTHNPVNRSRWAVVGGTVGMALGAGFPLSGSRGGTIRGGLPMGRDHLSAQEIQGLGVSDAYDAVAVLRPEWFQTRGDRSLAPSVDPVVIGGSGAAVAISGSTPLISEVATIQVYVDGVNLGGLDELRSVDILRIRDIYHFTAAQATLRWGGHNPHGAILIIT